MLKLITYVETRKSLYDALDRLTRPLHIGAR